MADKNDFYIDVHSHIFPDFYEEVLRENGINDVDGWKNPTWSVESSIKAMDENRIKTQMLSISSPGINFLEGTKMQQLGRRLNDLMAQLVKDHSPRFGLMAVLPLPDVDASLAEIKYAFDTLGADGVGLLSNYDGIYLGDPKLDPVFEELNRRKAVIFVHPTPPPDWKKFTVGLSAPVMEYTFDSTRMAQNLVVHGAKAKFRDLTIFVAHAGGTLPFTKQRVLKYFLEGKDDLYSTFAYEMTATTEPEQIRCLMATADPNMCFMGFDNPFMPPTVWAPLQKTLEAYDFPPGVLRSIQHGNALKLFPQVEARLRKAGQLT